MTNRESANNEGLMTVQLLDCLLILITWSFFTFKLEDKAFMVRLLYNILKLCDLLCK